MREKEKALCLGVVIPHYVVYLGESGGKKKKNGLSVKKWRRR